MNPRSTQRIIPAQKVNMGGHLLDQPLPSQEVETVDPFLLIHHWKNVLPGGQHQRDVGVGPHPHRGFSPVTFIFKGNVEHRDSLGNHAVVENGGTQWMFAGRGITHSERMSKELVSQGGELEFIQFWVNAPAANKMEQPFYKPISQEETPLVETSDSKIWVVSGQYGGVEGVAPTYTSQLLLRGEVKKDGELNIPTPTDHNTLIYVLEGGLKLNGQNLLSKDMAILNNDGDGFELKATADTVFIVLSGTPINEPILSYGPFVMNNETEIMQAIRDSQMGKMGILIEEFE